MANTIAPQVTLRPPTNAVLQPKDIKTPRHGAALALPALLAGVAGLGLLVLFGAILPAQGLDDSIYHDGDAFARFVDAHPGEWMAVTRIGMLGAVAAALTVGVLHSRLRRDNPAWAAAATGLGFLAAGALLLQWGMAAAEGSNATDSLSFAAAARPAADALHTATAFVAYTGFGLWAVAAGWPSRSTLSKGTRWTLVVLGVAQLTVLAFGDMLLAILILCNTAMWFLVAGTMLFMRTKQASPQ